MQVVAYGEVHLVAQEEIFANRPSADVEISVLHPKLIPSVGRVFNGERGNKRRTEHFESCHPQLYLTRRQLIVLAAAFEHLALRLQHGLPTKLLRLFHQLGIPKFVEGQLCDAVTVPEIDECHSAQLTYPVHPAAEVYGLSGVIQTQFATVMRSVCHARCYLAAKVQRSQWIGRLMNSL